MMATCTNDERHCVQALPPPRESLQSEFSARSHGEKPAEVEARGSASSTLSTCCGAIDS